MLVIAIGFIDGGAGGIWIFNFARTKYPTGDYLTARVSNGDGSNEHIVQIPWLAVFGFLYI